MGNTKLNQKAKTRILIVGQTPPPHNGQAIMINNILAGSYTNAELEHVRMSFSATMGEIGIFRFNKVLHLFNIILQITIKRFRFKADVLYYPPAGPNKIPMLRDIAILVCTRWLFKRTIFHFHAGDISSLYQHLSPITRLLFRATYYNADAAILLAKHNPRDDQYLKAKSSYIIPYGIADHAAARQFSRVFNPEPQHILFVGMLCESKGVLVLLSALAQLAREKKYFTATIVGAFESEELQSRCLRLVDENNLTHKVTFAGVLTGEAKWSAYEDADIFCFPTFYECETFGLVLVEAMQFGLPTISTHWRGVPSIVDEGETGVLVPIKDSQALANRISQLLASPERVYELGKSGRKKYINEYSPDLFIERMDKVFADLS